MRNLLTLLLVSAVAGIHQGVPAAPKQLWAPKSAVVLDAKGDIVRFYGIPMNLTSAGLKRLHFRYKVGHYSGEGDTYTFYTITADSGVSVEVGFDHGRLDWIKTSSPKAVGPRGIGVGSPLSSVKAAWPDGKLSYGVQENEAFVAYNPEPGVMGITYHFEPNDMPRQAFDRDCCKSRDIEIPDIRVKSIGYFPPRSPRKKH